MSQARAPCEGREVRAGCGGLALASCYCYGRVSGVLSASLPLLAQEDPSSHYNDDDDDDDALDTVTGQVVVDPLAHVDQLRRLDADAPQPLRLRGC
eukprot:1193591-Pyramimonas_sp.AAC.1